MVAQRRRDSEESVVDYKRERWRKWGNFYLISCRKSYKKACEYKNLSDHFSSYLWLFVTFNNLYAYLTDFGGGVRQETQIKCAIRQLDETKVNSIYTRGYVLQIKKLNDRTPRELAGESSQPLGVLNMLKFFQGKEPESCVQQVPKVAEFNASFKEKRETISEVTSKLLYPIRNNLFHAIKGPQDPWDESVVKHAYALLEPLIEPLTELAEEHQRAYSRGPD